MNIQSVFGELLRASSDGPMRHAAASAEKSNDARGFTLRFAAAWFLLPK
jgi:hypothetical protein